MENRTTNTKNTESMGLIKKISWRKINQRNDLICIASDKVGSKNLAKMLIDKKYILPFYIYVKDEKWKSKDPCVIKYLEADGYKKYLLQGGSDADVPALWFGKKDINKKIKFSRGPSRIILEPLIPNDPLSYRIDCFHGNPKNIQIWKYENKDIKDITTYSYPELKKIEVKYNDYNIGNVSIDKRIEKIIEMSKALSERFDYIQVNFMVWTDGIAFSKLNPYPLNGNGVILPKEFDEYLGGLWDCSIG